MRRLSSQESSLLPSMHKPLHEANHDLRVQSSGEDLPAYLALVGHCRNHAQLGPVGIGQHRGSHSLRRIAAAAHIIREQPCLVAPLNLCTLLLGLSRDLRLLLVDPLHDRLG